MYLFSKLLIAFFASGLFCSHVMAEMESKPLIYNSVYDLLSQNFYAFSIRENGDFIHDANKKSKKVGVENSIDDLNAIKQKINTLPSSLTSLTYYDQNNCPGDPEIDIDGFQSFHILGDQFADGQLDLISIKKNCVWNKVDRKSKQTIDFLIEYFSKAESLLVNN